MPANDRIAVQIAAEDETAAAFTSVNKRLQEMERRFAGAARGATSTGTAMTRAATGGSRQLRFALGQVGLQAQDVAVQLEMGTNPLRVFIQQGSQIAGAFGPAGAIIGAVGAGVAIAAAALFDFGESADHAKEMTDALDRAQGAINGTFADSAKSADDLKASIAALTSQEKLLYELRAQARIATAREDLEAANDAARAGIEGALNAGGVVARADFVDRMDEVNAARFGVAPITVDPALVAAQNLQREMATLGAELDANNITLGEAAVRYSEIVNASSASTEELRKFAGELAESGVQALEAQGRMDRLQTELRAYQGLASQSELVRIFGEERKAIDRVAKATSKAADETERLRAAQGRAELNSLIASDMAVLNALGDQRKREHDEFVKAQADALARDNRLSPALGLESGLAKVAADAADVAGQIESSVTGAFDRLEDAVAGFVMTGKLELDDLARSAAASFAQFGAGQLSGAIAGGLKAALFPAADGAVISHGMPVAFAGGGITNGPELFPMRGGRMGLRGEAGPEAIVPLPDGRSIPVALRGSSDGNTTVVNNIDARGSVSPGMVGMIARVEGDRGVRRALASLPRKRRSPLGI